MPEFTDTLDALLSPMLLIAMLVLLFCVIVGLKYDDGSGQTRADRNRKARARYDDFLMGNTKNGKEQ